MGTFSLTGVDVEPRKKDKKNRFNAIERTNAGPRILEHHQDLTLLANSLDKRMADLLREHEKDFFLAYKTHMYTVQKEIKTLRMKANKEEDKTREDTKIKALEGELDKYMTEALRLDDFCKGYKKEVDKWKAKAEALDEDRRFLEDQIKGAKRQNKILRAAAERARSSAYSALMATKAKSEAIVPAGQPRAEMARRPLSAGGNSADGFRPAAGSGAKRVMEARSRTPDARMPMDPSAGSPTGTLALQNGGATGSQSRGVRSLGASGLAASAVSLGSVGSGSLTPSGGQHGAALLGNEAEQRYVEAIQHLKEQIVREQQNVRMLQATRASSYSRKSELEEFFLKCIDEARKDLMRRRHMSVNKEKTERERVLEAVLNNEDVLVCLYEKLFPHRTGIARSLGAPPGIGVEEPTMLAQIAA